VDGGVISPSCPGGAEELPVQGGSLLRSSGANNERGTGFHGLRDGGLRRHRSTRGYSPRPLRGQDVRIGFPRLRGGLLLVSLDKPVDLDIGSHFAIREGCKTVGSGVITEVVE
jgi:hypothetical protein